MFAIRLVFFLFLTFYAYSMGQSPSHELNGFGKLVAFSFFLFAPVLYLQPTIEALLRKSRDIQSIALVNVLLGWSLIGWVVAMVWAIRRPSPRPTISRHPISSNPPAEQRETKRCPFCAEDILVAAIKCKHCGSSLAD